MAFENSCYWDLENAMEMLRLEIGTLEDAKDRLEHARAELQDVEEEMEKWCPYCLERKEDHSCLCREVDI